MKTSLQVIGIIFSLFQQPKLPLFNLRNRCTHATPTFLQIQIDLVH